MQPQPEPTEFSMLLDELRDNLKGKAEYLWDAQTNKTFDEVLCEEVGLQFTCTKDKKGQTVKKSPQNVERIFASYGGRTVSPFFLFKALCCLSN